MLQDMQKRKVKPNVVCYNTMIAALGRRGSGNRAFKLFNEVHIVAIRVGVKLSSLFRKLYHCPEKRCDVALN